MFNIDFDDVNIKIIEIIENYNNKERLVSQFNQDYKGYNEFYKNVESKYDEYIKIFQ